MVPSMLIAQATTEAAKASSYVTGQFLIDGALLIAGLKTIEVVVNKIRMRKNGTGPKPGEGVACRQHGEAIASLRTSEENTNVALQRIEGKVDRLLERSP